MEIKEIKSEIVKIVNEYNAELYDLSWSKMGSNKVLQVAIVNDEGVDVDTCQNISEKISDYLDTLEIEDNYYLEVCSAGVERELRNESEIIAAIGKYIYLKLNNPVKDVIEATGYLSEISNQEVVVDYLVKGAKKKLNTNIDNIKFIRLAVKI